MYQLYKSKNPAGIKYRVLRDLLPVFARGRGNKYPHCCPGALIIIYYRLLITLYIILAHSSFTYEYEVFKTILRGAQKGVP